MTLAKAKLASSITFIVLASFMFVTYDRQNMFIIQATGVRVVIFFFVITATSKVSWSVCYWQYFHSIPMFMSKGVCPIIGKGRLVALPKNKLAREIFLE